MEHQAVLGEKGVQTGQQRRGLILRQIHDADVAQQRAVAIDAQVDRVGNQPTGRWRQPGGVGKVGRKRRLRQAEGAAQHLAGAQRLTAPLAAAQQRRQRRQRQVLAQLGAGVTVQPGQAGNKQGVFHGGCSVGWVACDDRPVL
ncbi:hypothetical protein ACFSQE_17535 [Vogesella fluminis]|uniref:hypothetical protein n=1 Tax=Vogesella fluminis TaxID=1069161 RepID=UPI00363E390F